LVKEIYKVDFAFHLIGNCKTTEKIWDQLDLEYYDHQIKQSYKHRLKNEPIPPLWL